jgi:O-antigen/teichoic acid export membrane protein
MTPFYTRVFQQGEYGVVTELYAYAALLLVLLTYGMETTFFRYSEKEKNKDLVYSTSFISLLITSVSFIVFIFLFSHPIADLIHYSSHHEYIIYFGLIIGIDAFASIPFARLRQQNKAFRFAVIKVINVVVLIVLNVFFLWVCPWIAESNPDSLLLVFYSPEIGVGYAFISNLIASIVTLILLIPDIFKIRLKFDKALLKRMLNYSFPILIVGLLGMFNDVSDKIFLKYFWPDKEEALQIVGIYGANFKLAVLLTIFTQMFRYAAEPFFFAKAKDKDSKKIYADVMKYFVIFELLIFLGVTLYIDFAKYFIDEKFWEGLRIVPIILFAKIFFGITINLSIWYKLTDKTRYGAYINLVGAIVIISFNVMLIPVWGYMASAWGQFACYFSIMLLSFFLGRKHFRVDYDIRQIFIYTVFAVVLFLIKDNLSIEDMLLRTLVSTLLILLFVGVVYFRERGVFVGTTKQD